jgi:hypothetical protein
MELDSVRSLKMEYGAKLSSAFSAEPRGIRAFGVEATTIDRAAPFVRSAALGIAPRKDGADYYLAVRLQVHGVESHPAIEEIISAAGDEVDVQYIGTVSKRQVPWFQTRQRPLLIGSSVGHFQITAGTIGAFVETPDSDTPMILSNNHVLANENQASPGDAILQPGDFDGGQDPGDRVASLADFVSIDLNGANEVDCATATVYSGVDIEPRLLTNVGMLGSPVQDVPLDDVVEKIGRTTGHTQGRVRAFELDNVVVGFDMGNVRFDGQIEIEGAGAASFSEGGDSGSIIFTGEERNPFALLFAGSDTGGDNGQGLTYANPLDVVLSKLGVSLVS